MTLNSRSTCFPLPSVGLQCVPHCLVFCSPGNGTRGFLHARQLLSPLSHSPSPSDASHTDSAPICFPLCRRTLPSKPSWQQTPPPPFSHLPCWSLTHFLHRVLTSTLHPPSQTFKARVVTYSTSPFTGITAPHLFHWSSVDSLRIYGSLTKPSMSVKVSADSRLRW